VLRRLSERPRYVFCGGALQGACNADVQGSEKRGELRIAARPCWRRERAKGEPQTKRGGSLRLRNSNSRSAHCQVATALLTDAQALDNLLVSFGVPALQILQQAPPLAYHHQQSAP